MCSSVRESGWKATELVGRACLMKIRQGTLECGGSEWNKDENWPCERLLELRKAYSRVSKPALWMLLERYGRSGKWLETSIDVHETTGVEDERKKDE